MVTTARILANQRNARRSTGPRSTAGKKAASRNAYRHGLNISIAWDAPEVLRLADALAEDFGRTTTDTAVINAARAIVDVERVRGAYDALYLRLAGTQIPLEAASATVLPPGTDTLGLMAILAIFEEQWREPDGISPLSLPELARELARLARYERRAYSARTRALKRLENGSSLTST